MAENRTADFIVQHSINREKVERSFRNKEHGKNILQSLVL